MDRDAPPASTSGPYDSEAGGLTIAYGIAGALTYGFLGIASHNLDVEQYNLVVALYTAVFVAFSTLCRPIESYLSRWIARADAEGHAIAPVVQNAARIQASIIGAFLLAALVAREPLQEQLFGDEARLYWFFLLAVVGFSLDFFARGFLAGQRRFRSYAAVLIAEGVARISFVLGVAVGLQLDQNIAALAIAAAPFCSLLPLLIVSRRTPRPQPPAQAPVEGAAARGLTFTLGVVLILVGEQAFLSGGPLLVRLSETPELTGLIFNELVLAIAPLIVFQAALTVLLPHLTQLTSRREDSAFDTTIRTTLLAIAGFTAIAIAGVAAIGPDAMQVAFGDAFAYERAGLLIMTLGMGFYLAASTFNQAALAHGKATTAARGWALCATAFIAWNLLSPLDPVRSVETGFAGGAALLCLTLAWITRRQPRVV